MVAHGADDDRTGAAAGNPVAGAVRWREVMTHSRALRPLGPDQLAYMYVRLHGAKA